MKEAKLRTVHRTAGMLFAIFIVLQALTGLALTLEFLHDSELGSFIESIHTEFDSVGDIYRLIAGIGMLFMAFTGGWIGMKIRMRTKGSSSAR